MCAWFPPAFLSGSPGPFELLVVFLVILVLFGPRRLPEIARMVGKALHEMRRASEDFRNQIMSIESGDTEVLPAESEEPVQTEDESEEGEVRDDLAE